MKKLVLSTLMSVVAGAAFAQGTVNWVSSAGNVIAQTNSTVYFGGGAAVGGSIGNTLANTSTVYYYELLVSTTASSITSLSSLSSWSDTGLEAENGTTANGRLLILGQAQNATALNWAAGQSVNAILVGWTANLGTTYASAYNNYLSKWATAGIANSYFGVSSVASGIAAQAGNPGVTVFGAGLISNPSATPMQMDLLQTVPEPTTMALVGLGGAAMLAFRRKNK